MRKKKIKYPLIAVDLFSGSGGVSLGLRQAGFDVRAAVEIDATAMRTYTGNLSEVVINKDIRLVSGQEVLEMAGIKKGSIFLLAGCPPCQGFSSQRKNKNNDDDPRNQLVFEYIRIIEETEPAFILMENVPGMTRGNGKKIFDKAKERLEKNYDIKFEILNAADYGVPQTRRRLVLHGVRKDLIDKYKKNFENFSVCLPEKTHIKPSKRNDRNANLHDWKTVNVIRDLPPIESGEEFEGEGIFNHKSQLLSHTNLKRIRSISKNGGSRDELPDDLVLECHKKHTGHKDVYGRMCWEKPSPTITGGCLSYSKGRYGHPEQDRCISAREAARLQTFPDDYNFEGTLTQIALQIGNAVPVELAKASGLYFKNLINLIERIEQNSEN